MDGSRLSPGMRFFLCAAREGRREITRAPLHSLSALGGGEGWGEVGVPERRLMPTSPSRAFGEGPSLSPLKGGEGLSGGGGSTISAPARRGRRAAAARRR